MRLARHAGDPARWRRFIFRKIADRAMASPSDPADPGHASEPFRVPDTVARGGGPVTGNPFPSADPLHRVWAERTRKAEETINRRHPRRAAAPLAELIEQACAGR